MDHVFKVTVSVDLVDGVKDDAYPWQELSSLLSAKLFDASGKALVETFCDIDDKELQDGREGFGVVGNMKAWKVNVERVSPTSGDRTVPATRNT
jgi:hypothetical protein